MSKFIWLVGLLVLGAALFWAPGQIRYPIQFVDVQTNQPIANTHLVIHYDPVCTSSPCHKPTTIFDGQSDEKGRIWLKGHSTRDLNRFYGLAWLPGFEYSITADNYTRLWPEKGRNEHQAVVFLLKKHDVTYAFDSKPVFFNWSDITIEPAFDLKIGPTIRTELSRDQKNLYVATGQGGGIASFIYEIEERKGHFLGNNVRSEGQWLLDGRLEIRNRQQFGEEVGKVEEIYRSVSSSQPWILERVEN